MRIIIYIFLVFSVSFTYGQTDTLACIKKVLQYETKMHKDIDTDNTVYIKYRTSAMDWDKHIVSSEVEVYKNRNNIHFTSKEAKIYKDDKNLFLVLPLQQVVIIENALDEMNPTKMGDDYLKARERFLLSCDIVSCQVTDSIKGIKKVKLRVKEDLEGIIEIEEMTYTYSLKQEKVIKTLVSYSNNYKIKKMTITYLDFDAKSSYKFKKASKYVFSNASNPIGIYKNYEIIDNRNN